MHALMLVGHSAYKAVQERRQQLHSIHSHSNWLMVAVSGTEIDMTILHDACRQMRTLEAVCWDLQIDGFANEKVQNNYYV